MSEPPEVDITELIDRARSGDGLAENQLCQRVYDSLYTIAKRICSSHDTSMQPTMLVSDVFVKLFRKGGLKKTENRRYFYTVAADQMRKLLIDHYRRKKRQRVGGDRIRESFEILMDDAIESLGTRNGIDLEDLNDALEKLKANNERQFQVVLQRFFGGYTSTQVAGLLDVSLKTVERDWRLAKAKLYQWLGGSDQANSNSKGDQSGDKS